MTPTLTPLTRLFAVFVVAAALVAADATAQTPTVDTLPTIPSMPRAQDCENLIEAHLRLAARLRKEGATSQSTTTGEDADAVAARGRQLYEECLHQTFGGGGMGG